MRPSLGFGYWSMIYPDAFGAKKKPVILKNTCPKANDAFCLSFETAEIIMPKQVGAKHAPKNNRNHKPMMKRQGSN